MIDLNLIKEEAIRQSTKSPHKFKLGAVIFNRDRIISAGYNRVYIIGNNDNNKGNCAETLAIRKAPVSLLKGSSILVCRVNRSGALAMSKPCHRCQKQINKCGIKKIIYSTPDGWNTISIG